MMIDLNSYRTKITVAGALLGLIISAEPAMDAWDHMGLPTMATRGWVRIDTQTFKDLLRNMQLDQARGKRDNDLNARNRLEIDKLTYSDDVSKIKAEQEIRRLDENISALNEQINALSGIKGPK